MKGLGFILALGALGSSEENWPACLRSRRPFRSCWWARHRAGQAKALQRLSGCHGRKGVEGPQCFSSPEMG